MNVEAVHKFIEMLVKALRELVDLARQLTRSDAIRERRSICFHDRRVFKVGLGYNITHSCRPVALSGKIKTLVIQSPEHMRPLLRFKRDAISRSETSGYKANPQIGSWNWIDSRHLVSINHQLTT